MKFKLIILIVVFTILVLSACSRASISAAERNLPPVAAESTGTGPNRPFGDMTAEVKFIPPSTAVVHPKPPAT